MKISVIIASYNGATLLSQSLNLVVKALRGISCEIIIVDNGSSDATAEMISAFKKKQNITNQHRPRSKASKIPIRLIENKENFGFAVAVNQGANIAKGKYLLFLNNDCFVKLDTIKIMLSFLEKNRELVATQPIVYKMKKKKIENIGYFVDMFLGRAKVITNRNEFDNFKSMRYRYGLSATCLLIRCNTFRSVGMFDEKFHSYLEDVDLFIRLSNVGYKYLPVFQASCWHYHMATSKKMGSYKQYQDFKNWIRIIIKNFSLKFITRHFPTLFVERVRNLNGIVKTYLPS